MFRRIVSLIVCVAFCTQLLQNSYAQGFSLKNLPAPGKMVAPAANFMPLTLKGLVLHPENALKFDFLMDTGNSHLQGPALTEEARKIMTYFLTALTMPEDDLWVNLSPYEQGKIVEKSFGNTVMGRDLLVADYVLKQLTASLIYPEDQLGKKFWKEIYAKTGVSQSDIPIETVNKVWIVPSQAVVWENNGKVMIIRSKLRVMLEEDYLALKNNRVPGQINSSEHTIASQTVRTIILPVLEKQVNEGEHFAQLRQMYQAMILATWYKKALKDSILSKVYADQKKIKGIDNAHPQDIEAIYQEYLEAFKKGVFNYIREDVDQNTGETIPRKYFSGGFTLKTGLVALATALSVWSGTPTPAQSVEIAQKTRPVGETVLVQGLADETNDKGQAIRVAQAENASDVNKALLQSEQVNKQKVLELLLEENVDAVVQIGKPVVPVLIEALKSKYIYVRKSSVIALGIIGDESVVPVLTELVKDKDWDTRINAIEALDMIGEAYAVSALIETLKKDDYLWLYQQVIPRIGKIKDIRAIPSLRKALNAQEDDIVKAASEALERLQASWWQKRSDFQQGLLILLASMGGVFLGHGTYKFYKEINVYKLAEAKRVDKLLLYLDDADPIIRETAHRALDELVTDAQEQYQFGLSQLQSRNTENRKWAITMLARNPMKTREKIDLISTFLDDDGVRATALGALENLVTDVEERYQLGLRQIKSGSRSWAVNMFRETPKYKTKEKIDLVSNLLNDEDPTVRLMARIALDEWVSDEQTQYRISVGQIKSKDRENREWAIKMLARNSDYKNKEKIDVVSGLLNDEEDTVRQLARNALKKWVSDQQIKYQLGSLQIKKSDYQNQYWAIEMLGESEDERAIELLAEVLKKPLQTGDSYTIYNLASDALYKFGDVRSQYLYQFHPEEGHEVVQFDGSSQYGPPVWNWVVDKEAYWEKVRRSNGKAVESPIEVPVAVPESQENWITLNRNPSADVNSRIRTALATGKVDSSSIADARLSHFLSFLKGNNLVDIVVVGGAVRDSIAGKQVTDIDFTVKVPLSEDETKDFTAMSQETYARSEQILVRLAQALNVPVDHFKDKDNPVEFDGVKLQYLGPGVSEGPEKLVIKGLIVDAVTGIVASGFTGAEALFMGLDSNGKLYGHKRALENWLSGKIVLRGDLKEGHNMGPLMVLKILRLRHEFGLAILESTQQLMKKVMENPKAEAPRDLMAKDIQAVLNHAINKDLAKKELTEYGFNPSAQASTVKNNRSIISFALALGTSLYLWSAAPIPSQAAGFNQAVGSTRQMISQTALGPGQPIRVSPSRNWDLERQEVLKADKPLQSLNASWWLRMNNANWFISILLASSLAGILLTSEANLLQSAENGWHMIGLRMARMTRSVKGLTYLIDHGSPTIRKEAMDTLEKWKLRSNTRYNIGLRFLEKDDMVSEWAARMLVLSKKEDVKELKEILSNLHESHSDKAYYAEYALYQLLQIAKENHKNEKDKIAQYQKEQYKLGFQYLGISQLWAIKMLLSSERLTTDNAENIRANAFAILKDIFNEDLKKLPWQIVYLSEGLKADLSGIKAYVISNLKDRMKLAERDILNDRMGFAEKENRKADFNDYSKMIAKLEERYDWDYAYYPWVADGDSKNELVKVGENSYEERRVERKGTHGHWGEKVERLTLYYSLALSTALYLWSAVPLPSQAAGFSQAVEITQATGPLGEADLIQDMASPWTLAKSLQLQPNSYIGSKEIRRLLIQGEDEAIIAMGNKAIPGLIELLRNKDVGILAVMVLGKIGENSDYRDRIIEILHNELTAFIMPWEDRSDEFLKNKQIAIHQVLWDLGANVPQTMSDGARLILIAVGLGILGGGTFLYLQRKRMEQNKDAAGEEVHTSITLASQKPDQLGGITLDSNLMNMQIRRDGNGVPLPLSQQPLDQLNIQGFVPQILNIQTINLMDFLGLNPSNPKAELASL